MKNILINHQIPGEIIELIEKTKGYCFLVTPYYKPWALLERCLEKASKNKTKIIFILRNEPQNHCHIDLYKKWGFTVIFMIDFIRNYT